LQEKPVSEKAQAAIAPKPTRHYRARLFQGYVVTATIAFALLFFFARTVSYFTFDLVITRDLQLLHYGWLDVLMRLISAPGFPPQVYVLTGIVLLILFSSGLRWEAVAALFGTVGISALGLLVKLAVQRPRPSSDLVHVFQQLNSYSFPSGHVLFYTTFFGFLLFLFYTLLKDGWPRILALVILGSLVGLIGVSRVYLGEHWASDVLGAYLLGSLWLALTIYVYQWGKPRFFVRQPLAPERGHAPAS
jgi:membrane-associated phospholipid phosphatase